MPRRTYNGCWPETCDLGRNTAVATRPKMQTLKGGYYGGSDVCFIRVTWSVHDTRRVLAPIRGFRTFRQVRELAGGLTG